MSHTTIGLLIFLSIIIIPLILVAMHNHQVRTKENSMMSFFKKVAFVHSFSFTGQEILRNMVLGLDGPKRKVLIVEENNKNYDSHIIDLDEVSSCKIKKIYAAINIRDYKKNRPEEYLQSIALEFIFKEERSPLTAYFYRIETNSVYEIKELEKRVRNWEAMLSKMLRNKLLSSIS